jgi:hypothetical protein
MDDGGRDAGRSPPRTNLPHQPRRRRECLGELVQIDGSEHRWFEDRGEICYSAGVRRRRNQRIDATAVRRVRVRVRLLPSKDYLDTHGKPVAFYNDKQGRPRWRENAARPWLNPDEPHSVRCSARGPCQTSFTAYSKASGLAPSPSLLPSTARSRLSSLPATRHPTAVRVPVDSLPISPQRLPRSGLKRGPASRRGSADVTFENTTAGRYESDGFRDDPTRR